MRLTLPLRSSSLLARERSHSEAWAGCIVSLTTPTRSSFSASKSVSSLQLDGEVPPGSS